MNSQEFLQTIYAEADHGHTQLFSLPSAMALPITLSKLSIPAMPAGEDIYFSPGISAEPKSAKFGTDDIIGIPGLWIDIDILNLEAHAKTNLPADVEQAMSILPDDLPPSIIVSSGYGIHCYWIFRECWYFDADAPASAASELLIRLQAYIRHRASCNGWHIDSTPNLDRVLRLPGTTNYKIPGQPVMAQVIESCDIRYNPGDISETIPEIDPVTGNRVRKSNFERRPTDGPASLMLANCAFMTHAQFNSRQLSYQEWLAALTNLVRATDGIEAAHQISALDAERYNRDKTDRKIDECLSAMHPQSCEYIRRELGFMGCPAGGCEVKSPCNWSLSKIPQAVAKVRAIALPTPENTSANPEIVVALAIIQKDRPVEFDVFMQKCKGQLNQNTLKSEIKRQRMASSGLSVIDGGDSDASGDSMNENPESVNDAAVFGKYLAETVHDVPINLKMPRQSKTDAWTFTTNGVQLRRVTLNGDQYHRASHAPILITERIYNVDTQQEKARVSFLTRRGWRSLLLPKSTIFSSRSIMVLANSGLTINEDMAKYLAKWLAALEAANADIIPEVNGVSKLGWRNSEKEFVLPGMISNYTVDTGAESDGLLGSLGQAGDSEKWLEAMRHLRSKFRARFILAASFAAPLLKIVGQRTFIIYNWGGTTEGKTAALQAALSVWGRPEKLMLTFNNTQASLERMAEFFTDLPLGINEFETINDRRKTDQADQIIYMIAEGQGKGRANKEGNRQRVASWRTVSIMNGEGPITRAASKAGIITRVLEFHGGPLRGDIIFSSGLYRLLEKNHGFAGPLFVGRLLAENHEALSEQYNATRMALRQIHPSSLEAHVDAVACVVLADYLSSQWIFGATEPDAGRESVQMGEQILAELIGKQDANESERGWDWLQDWIASNKQRFETLRDYPDGDKNYTTRVSSGLTYGYIDPDEIHIIKTALSNELREAGFSPEKLYRQWADENKINSTGRGDGRVSYGTKNKRFNGSVPWVISIKT